MGWVCEAVTWLAAVRKRMLWCVPWHVARVMEATHDALSLPSQAQLND